MLYRADHLLGRGVFSPTPVLPRDALVAALNARATTTHPTQHRMQCDMVQASGEAIARQVAPMQSEQELFASPATLQAVEHHLQQMATILAHLPEPLQMRLTELDWHGWNRLQLALQQANTPRREEVWYGIHALVPATLEMLARVRKRNPVWFEVGY